MEIARKEFGCPNSDYSPAQPTERNSIMRITVKFTHQTRGISYYLWEIRDFSTDDVLAISGEYYTNREHAELAARQFMNRVKATDSVVGG